MKRPRVAIVTPAYQHAAFLAACIESVLAQTFEDWTMVIVDDGSTDATLEIARSYPDPRIRVLTQANKGLGRLAETYNAALAASESDLVAILEGDDFWPADKLAVQVADFVDERVVLSSGLFTMVDARGEVIGVKPDPLPWPAALDNDPLGEAFCALFHLSHLTFTWPVATVLRRSVLEQIGGFRQPVGLPIVDLPTFGRVALRGAFRFHADRSLGFWRRHSASATLKNLVHEMTQVHVLAGEILGEPEAGLLRADQVDAMDNQWASFQVQRLVLLARLLNRDGETAQAQAALRHALRFRGGLRRKLKVRLGLIALSLKLPMERLYVLAGMGPLEPGLALEVGDVMVDRSLAAAMPQPIDLVQAWREGRNAAKRTLP